MCSDPVIDSLTGVRNWWECHKDQSEGVLLRNARAGSAADSATLIVVAPNPAPNHRCALEWRSADSDAPTVTLTLTDATGRTVWSTPHPIVRYASVQRANLEFPALATGVYSLTVHYPNSQLQTRLIME